MMIFLNTAVDVYSRTNLMMKRLIGVSSLVPQNMHSYSSCCRETCPPAEIVPRNGCPAAARSTLHKTLIYTVVVDPHIYTVHTGDRRPAVCLAESEQHWRMPWPFG